jgi:hypothetical protein
VEACFVEGASHHPGVANIVMQLLARPSEEYIDADLEAIEATQQMPSV